MSDVVHSMYAGFLKRVAAYIIDVLVLVIPNFIIGFIVGFILAVNAKTEIELEIALAGADALINIISFLIGWIYFAAMESSSKQATLGKLALGIKVTDYDGNKISFGKATGRFFGKILSGIIFCIGFIMVAFTNKKQGLHDLMAGTLVVNKNE